MNAKFGGSPKLAAEASEGFVSEGDFKGFFGRAGVRSHWHHIVEKKLGVLKGWDKIKLIHNQHNLVKLPATIHTKLSGYYTCKQHGFTKGLSVRDWLANDCGHDYDCYYVFGLSILKKAVAGTLEPCL